MANKNLCEVKFFQVSAGFWVSKASSKTVQSYRVRQEFCIFACSSLLGRVWQTKATVHAGFWVSKGSSKTVQSYGVSQKFRLFAGSSLLGRVWQTKICVNGDFFKFVLGFKFQMHLVKQFGATGSDRNFAFLYIAPFWVEYGKQKF